MPKHTIKTGFRFKGTYYKEGKGVDLPEDAAKEAKRNGFLEEPAPKEAPPTKEATKAKTGAPNNK